MDRTNERDGDAAGEAMNQRSEDKPREQDTPRTDGFYTPPRTDEEWLHFARQLERELAEAQNEIADAANRLHDELHTGGHGGETLASIVERAVRQYVAQRPSGPTPTDLVENAESNDLVKRLRAACVQCENPAIVCAEWLVGDNSQKADLCESCCAELWRIFGRTTHFNFSPLSNRCLSGKPE